jgi:hypothetical protein
MIRVNQIELFVKKNPARFSRTGDEVIQAAEAEADEEMLTYSQTKNILGEENAKELFRLSIADQEYLQAALAPMKADMKPEKVESPFSSDSLM